MNVRINNLAAVLGFESDDFYEETVAVDPSALATADADIEDNMVNISSNLDTASNLANDAETLVKTEELVDNSIETGEGIDSSTAAIVKETIEGILRRHGLSRVSKIRNKISYPSVESFNDRKGKLNAARELKVSIEGLFGAIKDGIGSIFGGIKDFFTSMWKAIRAFETNMLENFIKLKDRAGNLTIDSKEPIVVNSTADLAINNKDISSEGLSDMFEQSVRQIKSPSGLEHMVKEFIKQFETIREQSNEKNIMFSKQMMEDFDRNIQKYKMKSLFIKLPDSAKGKPSRITVDSGKDLQRCCFPAIDLINLKPIAKLEQISDGFISHMMKSAASWFTSSKDRKDAEGGLKYKKEGQMTSVREVVEKINSAYKFIMYENIKIYKETLKNYYKVLLDIASNTSISNISKI